MTLAFLFREKNTFLYEKILTIYLFKEVIIMKKENEELMKECDELMELCIGQFFDM